MKNLISNNKMKKNTGTLIVLDGTDGSGKATQTKLLVTKLQEEGYKVETLDFPQYDEFFGKLIGECLNGEHGDWAHIDPKIASVLYAADRYHASATKITQWLRDGVVVVLDRYVSSNQIHQGGKIHDEQERKEFMQWLDKMEHEMFGIPRPDVIVYLDVPLEVTRKLLQDKASDQKKSYKTSGTDAHEDDVEHLLNAKQSALKILTEDPNWIRITCYESDVLLSREAIHQKIYSSLKNFFKE